MSKRTRFHMPVEEEGRSVPQSFTISSKKLNGRAAMIGFTLSEMTEAIIGKGIVGKINSVANGLSNIGKFPLALKVKFGSRSVIILIYWSNR